ncbi:vanadium-dependent haloperoxidase [Pseudoxanthomonas sp.]|uniref:vanadium-dependent haloperoxidase n=1 Tax=Pseudoxanthomonas sp. TaxID=1871049 RepID=UPI0025D2BEEA|nr:vanadium-dependent haloperoxidase [Pseudoxanthomonas sp.]
MSNVAAFFSIMLALSFWEEARADVVTDWNRAAMKVVVEAKVNTPTANRTMAIVQTSVYEAVNQITQRYPSNSPANAEPASIEAAIAAANRVVLGELLPSQSSHIERLYQVSISTLPDDALTRRGIAIGELSARKLLRERAGDGANTVAAYRPVTQPGTYVATTLPIVPQWPQRKPWLMSDATQFRPAPPPSLDSAAWAQDFNEIKELGARESLVRTPAQTELGRFWETTLPVIFYGIVYSITDQPSREVTQNARLLMAVNQAMDDAIIAVFDAKYHYGFWRPITAIRNGDLDGSEATERDGTWLPLIDTPMHPEYPCAHCIVASTVGTVLGAESDGVRVFSTTSDTAPGVKRSWNRLEDFVAEVSEARIYDGVHFRTSTQVAKEMGEKIGRLAIDRHLREESDAKAIER